MIADRPPSDPFLAALGSAEQEQQKRAEAVEDAVDRRDLARLEELLGGSREDAERMLAQLAPPDETVRSEWRERWDAERKVRRLPSRVYQAAGALSVAAAAAATFLVITRETGPAMPELISEIISRPAQHLSGHTATAAIPAPAAERHREVAGDILRIALTSAAAQPAEADVAACFGAAFWEAAFEREDELHSTVGIKIPDDARGDGELRLIFAAKGAFSDPRHARAACLDPNAKPAVTVAPPITVEPNLSRRENRTP